VENTRDEIKSTLLALFVDDKILSSLSEKDLDNAVDSFIEKFLSDDAIEFSTHDVVNWTEELKSKIINESLIRLQQKGLIHTSVDEGGNFIFRSK
jgi:hypothetical protein